ncbi:acyl-CoA desaturase [Gynuella sunshinyii]|nr:acyl-CoA desaturase [Gynuella sunshinyii]
MMDMTITANDQTGIRERQLAWITVGTPTIGTLIALGLAWYEGIGALEIGLLCGMYLLTALGVEVGLHRFFSHRAFKAGPGVTAFFAIAGSMAAQGPILFWAATHRQHHSFTDKEGDPHSPCLEGNGFIARLKGWWHAHVGWLFTVKRKNWSQFVPDLFSDRTIVKLNQYYFLWVLLGLLIPTAIGAAIDQSYHGALAGLLWGGFVRIFLVDNATWCVNSMAHRFGRRPNTTRDNSRNLFWLAIPTVGGGWHNNHHAYPALAYTGLKPWQIDIGGRFIDLLGIFGLVWDIRKPEKKSPENTLDGTPDIIETAAPEGISHLDPPAARLKAAIALAVMLIPLAGFLEAIRLLLSGQLGSIDLTLFLVFYAIQMFGVSMGFHRYLAHRAFKTSRTFRALLLIAGSMAAQGPILFWVTTHRRHHRYSDHPGDPHSPNLLGQTRWQRLKGLWYAHMPWMLAPDMTSWSVYAKDVLRDRSLFFFNQTYLLWVLAGVAIPAAIGGWVTESWAGAWSGFICGGLARMFLANQFAWAVGSICHRYGSQPFDNNDHSTNNWTVATLTFGEGLQNNHHAFPAWYRHGVHWYEPDLSGWVLTLLGKMGVVWDLRSPSRAAIEKARQKTN